ncbi:MAG TPA: hypothetical protein ENN73_02055 [Firmicutes bacterium]|nr:hypothetical protein [Bacillota bacterium]
MKKTFMAAFLLFSFFIFGLNPVHGAYIVPDEIYDGYVWADSLGVGYEAHSGFLAPNYMGGFYFYTLCDSTWDPINDDHLYYGAVWLGNSSSLDYGGDYCFINGNTFEMEYAIWDEVQYSNPVLAAGGYETYMKTRGMYTDLTIDMRTFSDYNDSFIVQLYIIKNETETDYTGLYFGQVMDYDINGAYSFVENTGVADLYISDEASGYKEKDDWAGFDPTYEVGYMYDFDAGINNPLYFGMKCLTDDLASFNIIEVEPEYISTAYLFGSYVGRDKLIYDLDTWLGGGWPMLFAGNHMVIPAYQCYDYMSNGKFDTGTKRPGDYEILASVGPFDIASGNTKVIAFAIGGNVGSKDEMIEQMISAQLYYDKTVKGKFNDAIPANAPVEDEPPYEKYNTDTDVTEAVFKWTVDGNISDDYSDGAGYNVHMTIDWNIFIGIYVGLFPTPLHTFYSDNLYKPDPGYDGFVLTEGVDYTAGDSVQVWVSAIGEKWNDNSFPNPSKTLIMSLNSVPDEPELSVNNLPQTSPGSDVLLIWSETSYKDQDLMQYNIYRTNPGADASSLINIPVATILTTTRIIDLYGSSGLDGDTLPLLILNDGSTYRYDSYRPDYDLSPEGFSLSNEYNFSTSHLLVGDLDTGTTYYFQVTLTDFSGLVGESDPQYVVLTPGAPLNLVATMGEQIVRLQWVLSDDPNVFKYNVYRTQANPDGSMPPRGTSSWKLIGATLASATRPNRYVDRDIQDNQKYFYYVTAFDRIQNKEGYPSNYATVTTTIRASKDLEGVIVAPNPYKKGVSTVNHVVFARLTKEAEINIYTLSGTLVKTLTHNPSTAGMYGPGSCIWDVTNEDGEEVASGLYLWIATNPAGDKKSGRLVIIR